MPVWIDRLNVETLGPLTERSFTFDRFNLIYGPNETGKTFLVEFLLQSLFRHAQKWTLRDIPGRGKITLVGLEDGQSTDFTPGSRKKLEDFWEEEESGLPTNMAQLLVVKGGELDLSTKAPGGVGRGVLKTALSRETLLDQILDSIRKTVQDAEIKEGEIIADRRAKNVQRREEIRENLRKMEAILDRVEKKVSRGPLRTQELKLEKVQQALAEQIHAKQHRAYRIHRELERWKDKRSDLPDHKVETLRDDLRDYQKTQDQLSKKREELAEKKQASQHYPWLEQALDTWETQGLNQAGQPNPLFAGAGLLLLLIGAAISIFQRPLLSLALLTTGGTSIAYYLWRLRGWSRSVSQSQDRENIRETYKENFGEALRDIAQLKTKLESTRESHIQANQIRSDVEELEKEKAKGSVEIRAQFQDLTGETVQEENWEEHIKALRSRVDEIEQKIKDLELEQRTLGISEEEFRAQPADTTYDESQFHDLEDKVQGIETEIDEKKGELRTLKQRICNWTGDEIDIPWNKALEHFQTKYKQAIQDYQQLTAEIVAKIGVTQVLAEVRQQEDEKIRRGLCSQEVIDILQSVTGIYQSLDLSEEQVLVEGPYGDYPLSELSTGAQEQIQLALRMGFASRLSEGEPLFLVLDDAFQYSDWERRERLVKKVISMAKNDWQIIYLTMDEHLRDLFQEAGERLFPDAFRYYELTG